MSVSPYRFVTHRPAPSPPPLRLPNSNRLSKSTTFSTNDNTEPLLYDLPSAISPPPTSTSFKSDPISPVSPTSRTRQRGNRGRRTSPSPASHFRSPTPLRALDSDLDEFAEHCRAWYFKQDDDAGRLMTQTLSTLPPSQRAPFSRLQARIRSEYHAHISAQRTAEFQARLSAMQPGGSLMAVTRANPDGKIAHAERLARFERFVRTWCTMGMPGTKPFFEGLWGLTRLQTLPQRLGGAGDYRIEWEIDDAVFKEAAGKDFMFDAIDILKGVLAFEEVSSPRRSVSIGSLQPIARTHSRSQSQPLSPGRRRPARSPPQAPTALDDTATTRSKRPRAPSDPFLDAAALSHSLSSTPSTTSVANNGTLLSASAPSEESPSPITPPAEMDDDSIYVQPYNNSAFADAGEEECLRTWISPDLSNPEFTRFLKVFPTFVTRRQLPRFSVAPTTRKRREADLEEGGDDGMNDERITIRFGTGTMRISTKQRREGWKGGWWTRLVHWFKGVFC